MNVNGIRHNICAICSQLEITNDFHYFLSHTRVLRSDFFITHKSDLFSFSLFLGKRQRRALFLGWNYLMGNWWEFDKIKKNRRVDFCLQIHFFFHSKDVPNRTSQACVREFQNLYLGYWKMFREWENSWNWWKIFFTKSARKSQTKNCEFRR